jgi:hypothetical protein
VRKLFWAGVLIPLFLCAPAHAQQGVGLYCFNPTGSGLNQWLPCSSTNPLFTSGGGGGGGGSVYGPTAAGSPAANPPVLMGGTVAGTATGNVDNWKVSGGIGYVNCSNCSGSGVSVTDEAAFTAGTSLFAPGGGFYQTTATSNPLTNGQQGLWQMTANRAGFVNLRNAAGTEIGTSSTPVQVSVANTGANGTAMLVTGTGGAFPATQSTSPWIVAGGGTAGTPGTAVLTVQGVGSGTAIPVSGTFWPYTLGQQLAGSSVPVVLTAAQLSTLTPPAAITNYAQETGGNLATTATNTGNTATNVGAPGSTVCSTDTNSCNGNSLLQRIAQRLTSIITALGSPFQAGGSIGNTSFISTNLANINGTGSTTHSSVTTAYAAGELFANNTSGNATASTVTVSGTNAGTGYITHAMVQSSGTNQPPAIILWLFSGTPTTTSLVDRSAYLGPYAADFTSGIVLGSLNCTNWQKTNDGTAQYFTECSASNLIGGPIPFQATSGATTIKVLEEINGAYTPLSAEVHTYILSTARDN